MGELHAAHMTKEIQANIRTGDAVKACLWLDHLGQIGEESQNRLPYQFFRGDEAFRCHCSIIC